MLLFSGREVGFRELAQQMSCSKQTIMRDMEKLKASKFGKLLCEKKGESRCTGWNGLQNCPDLRWMPKVFSSLPCAGPF